MAQIRIEEELHALEEQLLDPVLRRDATFVSHVLAEGFREFGSSGRTFDKASMLAHLQQDALRLRVTIEEFRAERVSDEAVLVTYLAVRDPETDEGSPTRSWRSSLWLQREGRWQMLFHQGTRMAHPERVSR
ncbi:DUF4440 domain-containing protein [Paracidobacterium acidisoli]|uniref:Nuclear transport factor 2 family protein n=1 Tax=Paracidobacterium acidisoli TaxID=2303751 RepID=A0A372ILK4_9BACT|nr:nuclear transport factor 2 family protein [Paracidobacterium acidisoli]MBT9332226.1 nuclear transport factor 2 family protein [Paracidobacterium acidisoli]